MKCIIIMGKNNRKGDIKMRYYQWLDEWLENYVKPSSKIRTYETYVHLTTHHIKAKLGNYELDALTPMILQKFFTELMQSGNVRTGKGLSSNSVNSIITLVQTSLRLAFDLGLCQKYAADRIKRPKKSEKEISCFSIAEQKQIERFVRESKKRKLFGILLCLYSGLRVGELLALEWQDVDFAKGIISVGKSCHNGKDENGKFIRITDTPKTSSSKRIIPLPKQIMPLLKEHKKRSISQFVVADDKGNPVFVRSYQHSFELILKKLNIEHKGFHSLRHTFATRALECGMDIKTLADILGHKNPTVTLNRYVHSLLEHKAEMMNRLGKLL